MTDRAKRHLDAVGFIERQEAREVLQLLRNYCDAYPEDVFPTPPDHLRAKDAAAADVMRVLALPMMDRAANVIEQLLEANYP